MATVMNQRERVWRAMTHPQRWALCNWLAGHVVKGARLDEALTALTGALCEAGLPGTGAGVTPENATDCEQVAAPEPEPAHICAVDDEC